MKPLQQCASAVAGLFLLAATSSQASVYVFGYTGIIDAGEDSSGMFFSPGRSLVGRSFTVTYRLDDAVAGSTEVADAFSTQIFNYSGGLASFSMTMNGKTYTTIDSIDPFSSVIDGISNYRDGAYDMFYAYAISTRVNQSTGNLSKRVFGANHNGGGFLGSNDWRSITAAQLASSANASGDFDLSDENLLTGEVTNRASGHFTITGVVVGGPPPPLPSAVPEPATWGLLIVGFGFLGSRLRNTRTRRLPT